MERGWDMDDYKNASETITSHSDNTSDGELRLQTEEVNTGEIVVYGHLVPEKPWERSTYPKPNDGAEGFTTVASLPNVL